MLSSPLLQLHSDMYNKKNDCFSIISKGRREDCLKVSKLNITVYQNYYQYKTISVFNELPVEIGLIRNKRLFKTKI